MSRRKTVYVCSECGAPSAKWVGQCGDCGQWNTLAEVAETAQDRPAGQTAMPIGAVAGDAGLRHATGFGEFDRVLGGGLVPGAVVLLGGDPGVGKSTLLQQVAANLAATTPVCFASGEESLRQIAERAQRLDLAAASLNLLAETSLETVMSEASRIGASVLVVDSIQTLTSTAMASAPGSVSQLRECVGRLVQFAKQRDVAVFLVGHVTKEGAIAGPRVVEHIVDTVLYVEADPASRYTLIRSVKNRFGATGEMGVFAMTGAGFREVSNPSAIFLSRDSTGEPGSIVSVAWEGSRPLLVEIQALVADSAGGYSRRLAQGVDPNRLGLLLAVLQRHGGIELGGDDVFVNVVGGLRIAETAVDLPALLAIVSSHRNRHLANEVVAFGEIGLAGEVRPVRYGEERIAAAAKQGFKFAIVPRGNVPKRPPADMRVLAVRKLAEALHATFDH